MLYPTIQLDNVTDKVQQNIENQMKSPIQFIVKSHGLVPVPLLTDIMTYWLLWILHKNSPRMYDRELFIWGNSSEYMTTKEIDQRRQEVVLWLARALNVTFSCDVKFMFQ